MELIRKLTIRNDLGLHARAAAKIVALAGRYKSEIFIRKEKKEVNTSSILSILTLSCPKGTVIEAKIVGEDAAEFMERLTVLFEQRFGEGR
jgi:phosphotransferase system HPr (HPr) family protein